MSASSVPLGNGSRWKRRTSRRQIRRSRRRARNALSKLTVGLDGTATLLACEREGWLMVRSLAALFESGQRNLQPPPRLRVCRQSEAQPVCLFGKSAYQNAGPTKMIEQFAGRVRAHEAEQIRSPHKVQVRIGQDTIKLFCRTFEAVSRFFDPRRISKRLGADCKRGSGNRPGAKHGREPRRDLWRRKREAEPHSGKAEKFAERAQHYDVAAGQVRRKTGPGRTHIHERFIDHEQATVRPQVSG